MCAEIVCLLKRATERTGEKSWKSLSVTRERVAAIVVHLGDKKGEKGGREAPKTALSDGGSRVVNRRMLLITPR